MNGGDEQYNYAVDLVGVPLILQSSGDLSIRYEGAGLPNYQTNMVIMSLANFIKPLLPIVNLRDYCWAWSSGTPVNPIVSP